MSIFVGRQTPATRLRAWVQHAADMEQRLNSAAKSAHDYFELLYVLRDDNARTVQLFAGKHPIGTSDRGKLLVEGGATFVVSQDRDLGHVAVLIYPYERDGSPSQPIHWGWFDGPGDVSTGNWLNDAVHDFARCCRASSAIDSTVMAADRRRMRWLQLRSRWLLLRARAPGGMKLINAQPSLLKRLGRFTAIVFTALAAILAVPSAISTLWGVTVPSLFNSWKSNSPAPNPAVAPAGTIPSRKSAPASIDMPIISGEYTFCASARDPANRKLMNLLYDVRAHAGKIAFFNVWIRIDCVLGQKQDYLAPFRRAQNDASVGYYFHVPLFAPGERVTAHKWLDGGRNPESLRAMYSDNGSAVLIHRTEDGRNPLSRFQPHVEGTADILFGPYAIKASEDDDALSYDLYAPTLDSAALQQASAIAATLRQSH